MILTFIILFIAIAISQVIQYWILKKEKEIPYSTYIGIGVIIITYIIFSYLTYNPPKVEFFFDPLEEKYGINTYVIR